MLQAAAGGALPAAREAAQRAAINIQVVAEPADSTKLRALLACYRRVACCSPCVKHKKHRCDESTCNLHLEELGDRFAADAARTWHGRQFEWDGTGRGRCELADMLIARALVGVLELFEDALDALAGLVVVGDAREFQLEEVDAHEPRVEHAARTRRAHVSLRREQKRTAENRRERGSTSGGQQQDGLGRTGRARTLL